MAVRWCRLYRGTEAELALEDAVAALGVPYRTQFPGFLFGVRYFVDFYLPTLGLVIEVDDPSHERNDKREADAERTKELQKEWGVMVLRCTNEDAINDPHGTVRRMMADFGIQPSTARKTMAQALPKRKPAPQKAKRAAKSAALQAKRRKKRQ